MTWLLSLALKSTAVLAAAVVVAASLRRASSSTRHTVWTLALAGLLLFPVLGRVLPRWEVPVLPPPPSPVVSAPALSAQSFEIESSASYEAEPLVSLPAAAPATPPAAPTWTWREAMVPVWLLGVAFGLAQLGLGTLLIALTVRRARPVADEAWRTLLDESRARLALARPVELRQTGSVPLPVVWGYRRPVILLPRDAADWPIDRRRAFLLHELSHVARYDCFTQTLAYVVRALYWPQPLVWWAVASLRREAERACDDRVVAAGTEAPEYAQHLLEAARSLPRAPRTLATASAVIERTSLGDRLLALLDERLERGTITTRALAVTAAAAFVAVAAVAALQPVARAAVVETVQAMVTAAAPAAATPTPAPSAAPPRPTPRTSASTLALVGIVKGPDGKPIEKALVIASGPSRGLGTPGRTASTRSDAAGQFRVDALSGDGPYELRVEAAGLAPARIEGVGLGASIPVQLDKGAAIDGVVLDARTRRPVAKAVVSVAVGAALPSEPGAGRIRATSDAQGRYRLEGLPPGVQMVTATALGYENDERRVPGGTKDATFYMQPGGSSISGIVKGPDGKPVADAQVAADSAMPIGARSGPVLTDEAGRFSLDGMEPGNYRLVLHHSKWAPLVVPDVATANGTPAPIEITMAQRYRLKGRLVYDDQHGARGYVMVQALEGSELPSPVAQQLVADAGTDGRFEIDGVPAGALTLAVRPLRFAASRAQVVVGGRDSVFDAGDIRVERGRAIRGRVRSKDGAPIADAHVYVPAARDPGDTRTGDDGTFVMAGVRAGKQDIAISAEGYALEERPADPDGPPVEVVLQPAGTIVGQLVDRLGQPVSGASVVARGEERRRGNARLTETDGLFRIRSLAAGTYALEVQPREHLDKQLKDVKVEVGRATDVGRIVLDPGATVRGVVVDVGGAPVAGALVGFEDAAQSRRNNDYGQVQRATTDAQGRFTLKGLSEGVAKLGASHRLYASSTPVEVAVAADMPEVRLTLMEGARITGTARRRDGQPVANAFVLVKDAGLRGGLGMRAGLGQQSMVGSNGTFTVEHVAPGPTKVTLMDGGAGVYTHVVETDVDVRDGETVRVDLDVREVIVSGRIMRGGKPVAQHHVLFSDGSGGTLYAGLRPGVPAAPRIPRREADTRDDGTYELIVPGPGKYEIFVRPLHDSSRGGTPKVPDAMVPDTAVFRHDINVADWSLTGKIVAKDTQRPLERASISARPAGGEPGGASTSTDAEGRYRLALEPGRYLLRAQASKYVAEEVAFEPGAATAELHFELAPGASIKGHTTNAAGVARARTLVVAVAADGRTIRSGTSDADGAFAVEGLTGGRHLLFAADAERPDFGMLPSASPGDAAVPLALVPGARVRFTFKDANGRPIAGSNVRLDLIGIGGTPLGVEGRCAMSQTQRTDDGGMAEYRLPSGVVDLVAAVGQPALRAESTIVVAAEITATAEMRLLPRR